MVTLNHIWSLCLDVVVLRLLIDIINVTLSHMFITLQSALNQINQNTQLRGTLLILHIKVSLLVMGSTTQLVKTFVWCLLCLSRSFLMCEKITSITAWPWKQYVCFYRKPAVQPGVVEFQRCLAFTSRWGCNEKYRLWSIKIVICLRQTHSVSIPRCCIQALIKSLFCDCNVVWQNKRKCRLIITPSKVCLVILTSKMS